MSGWRGMGALLGGMAWRVALLGAAYGLFIVLVRPTVYLNLSDAGTQNRIVAERFLALGKSPRAVLVGSSMSRHLESGLAEADPGIYDLAFFGGSPLTGNELVLQAGRRPRVVVIEVNNLRQPLDTSFVTGVTAEPGAVLRRICPALRIEYQPLRVLQSAGRTLGAWGKPPHPVPDPDREEPTPHLDGGVAFFVGADERTGEDERDRVRLDLAVLGAQVERLEARGVQVLFVSLPADPRVEEDTFRRFVHREALARFPEAEWPWLDFPSDGSFRTTDGVHLTEPSARRAAALIAEKVRLLLAHSRS